MWWNKTHVLLAAATPLSSSFEKTMLQMSEGSALAFLASATRSSVTTKSVGRCGGSRHGDRYRSREKSCFLCGTTNTNSRVPKLLKEGGRMSCFFVFRGLSFSLTFWNKLISGRSFDVGDGITGALSGSGNFDAAGGGARGAALMGTLFTQFCESTR